MARLTAGTLAPITAEERTPDRAAHLLERAGFGGTPAQVRHLASLTPQEAVAQLIVGEAGADADYWSCTSVDVAAFQRDIDFLGRGDDVVVMVFSEFGRRVAENTSLGTDHGTAGPAFIIGKPVKGGHYGAVPSLTDLDEGNLRFTTDYRRLYATLIRGWMGNDQAAAILKDDFAPLPLFAA